LSDIKSFLTSRIETIFYHNKQSFIIRSMIIYPNFTRPFIPLADGRWFLHDIEGSCEKSTTGSPVGLIMSHAGIFYSSFLKISILGEIMATFKTKITPCDCCWDRGIHFLPWVLIFFFSWLTTFNYPHAKYGTCYIHI